MAAAPLQTGEVLQIKRYPNRRYYARHAAKYISLQDIEQLVREGNTVEIRDHGTGDDITQSVLTQMIVERHPDKVALFPVDMLHLILRANDVMTDVLRGYFRDSLGYLKYLQEHGSNVPLADPLRWMEAWLNLSAPPTNAQSAEYPAEKSVPDGAGETQDQLDERIAALEERLHQLEANDKGTNGASPRRR